MNALLKQLFCVPVSTGSNEYRVSLTKTGATIQMFATTVGGSVAGISLLADNQMAAAVTAGVFVLVGGIGRWLEAVGKRDAMEQTK